MYHKFKKISSSTTVSNTDNVSVSNDFWRIMWHWRRKFSFASQK